MGGCGQFGDLAKRHRRDDRLPDLTLQVPLLQDYPRVAYRFVAYAALHFCIPVPRVSGSFSITDDKQIFYELKISFLLNCCSKLI